MSGANLALFALHASIGGASHLLPILACSIGVALALTVLLDAVWAGPDAGWPSPCP